MKMGSHWLRRRSRWALLMQCREDQPQHLAVVHVHCARGILECLLCVITFSVRARWGPARPLSECLPGLDQITNRLIRGGGEQAGGEPISKSGHCGSAPCRGTEPLSPFCISMMLCVPGRVGDTCLRVRKPLALHQPPALNEHNWLWWDPRSGDNTRGLFRLFAIRLFQVLRRIQYQQAHVLVFLHSTV